MESARGGSLCSNLDASKSHFVGWDGSWVKEASSWAGLSEGAMVFWVFFTICCSVLSSRNFCTRDDSMREISGGTCSAIFAERNSDRGEISLRFVRCYNDDKGPRLSSILTAANHCKFSSKISCLSRKNSHEIYYFATVHSRLRRKFHDDEKFCHEMERTQFRRARQGLISCRTYLE